MSGQWCVNDDETDSGSVHEEALSKSQSTPIMLWWLLVLALAFVYVVTARLGLLLALPPENKATAIWPPSGIAFAALILLGTRAWPGIWIGAFCANMWDYFYAVSPLPLSAHLLVSSGIATGSTLQSLAGTWLIRNGAGIDKPFNRVSHAFIFAGVAFGMCIIGATLGSTSLYLGGFASVGAIGFIWWTWWMGDMTGVLIIGSLLLAWGQSPPLEWTVGRIAEAGILLLVILNLGFVIFGIVSPQMALPPTLAYLIMPCLVWATFRFGLHGATTALVVVSALAVLGTCQGVGPFAQPSVAASLLLVQIFMAVVSLTILIMAAVLNERRLAEVQVARNERRWKAIAAAVPGFLYTCRKDGWNDYTNPRFYDYTGVPQELNYGLGWVEGIHPEERDAVQDHFVQCIQKQQVFEHQYRYRAADGSYRWFLDRAVPMLDEKGQLVGWAGICVDIDDKHQLEDQLRGLNATLEENVIQRTTALQESERRLRALFHSQFQFIGLLTPSGHVLEANRSSLAASGVLEQSVLGRPFWETVWWSHSPEQQDRLRHAVQQAALGQRIRFEATHPSASGELIWVDFSLTPFFNEAGEVVLLIPEGRDITERKRAEQALLLQEEMFRSAFDHAPIGIALIAPDGKWLRVNRSVCEILGYSESELLETTLQAITHPDDLEVELGLIQEMLRGERRTYQLEKRYYHIQGHSVFCLLSVSLVNDGAGHPIFFVFQIKDISERKQADDQLIASLREKEVLLKEIHHRVKNNLQIVSSLLDLQSDHTQDQQAVTMFLESRGRVKSMALIHEKLYRSQDLARVNFGEYVRQLAEDLYRTYKLSDEDILLQVDVSVPPLPIDIAIPCGLLLNELMSNCFKHAFAENATGWIRVALQGGDKHAVLSVADNGAGFPASFNIHAATTFGLQLVHTLTEQLQGRVEVSSGHGSAVLVTFPMVLIGHLENRP